MILTRGLICVLLMTSVVFPSAGKGATLVPNVFLSLTLDNTDIYARTHTQFYFGEGGLGLFLSANHLHSYLYEGAVGISFQGGGAFYVSFDVGVIYRHYTSHYGNQNGRGFVAIPAVGYDCGKVRIYLPVYGRYFISGTFEREIYVDGVPHLGLEVSL